MVAIATWGKLNQSVMNRYLASHHGVRGGGASEIIYITGVVSRVNGD